MKQITMSAAAIGRLAKMCGHEDEHGADPNEPMQLISVRKYDSDGLLIAFWTGHQEQGCVYLNTEQDPSGCLFVEPFPTKENGKWVSNLGLRFDKVPK